MEFDTWMKASSAQSIKPTGWPVPNWNTMNTGERMFFLFVYLDASVEQYLFGFKLDMESIIYRDFTLFMHGDFKFGHILPVKQEQK